MTRYLACPKCGQEFKLHEADAAGGWKIRKIEIKANKPEDMNIEFHVQGEPTKLIPVTTLVCDLCNEEIKNGSPAIAITLWQGKEPERWEVEYLGTQP